MKLFLTPVFLIILLISSQVLAMSPEGKLFLKSLHTKSQEDQVSELVAWLTDFSRAQADRLYLGYLTANLALDSGNYKVAQQFYLEVSQSEHFLAPYAATQLALIYCQKERVTQKCLSHLKDLQKNSQVQKSKTLKWQWLEQAVLFHLEQKNWNEVRKLLKKQTKVFRSTDQSLAILDWKLKLAQGTGVSDCDIRTEIYVGYPKTDLDEQDADWMKSCSVSAEDKRKRIRKMMLLGFASEIPKEIKAFSELPGVIEKDVQVVQADFYLRQGENKKALEILETLSKNIKSSKDSSVLSLYALALSRSQRFEEASKVYLLLNQVVSTKSEKSQSLFDSAFVLYQGALYPQAIESFKKYLAKYSKGIKSQEARWYLGWLSYLDKRYPEAQAHFESLAKTKSYPEKNKVLYWLAKAYWEQYFIQEALDIMTAISQQSESIYSFYATSARQWLVENSLKPTLAQMITKPASDCFQVGCSDLLNLDGPFKIQSPDISHFIKSLKIYETNERPEESIESESVAQQELPLDLHTLTESEAFASEFSDRLKVAQNLFEIQQPELAFSEIRSLYYSSSLADQKLILLKVFENLKKYDESARLAELYLLYNPRVERLPWLAQAFPSAYAPEVETYSKKFGVEKSLIYSIMRAESFFNPKVESVAHARGLMQLMPFTADQVARSIGESKIADTNLLFNPDLNIKLGTAYLSRLLRQFDQNYILASAAYNAGPHRVQTWLSQFGSHDQDVFIEHIPFKETRGYVKKVMGFMNHYNKSASLLGPLNVREVIRIPASKERWDDI